MNRHGIKLKRLEKAYQQALCEALLFKVRDPRLENVEISINRVEINQDMSVASVFFTLSDNQNKNKVIKALYSAAPFFLSLLKEKIKIKYLPNLKFFYDEATDKGNKVLKLIDELTKQKSKDIQ